MRTALLAIGNELVSGQVPNTTSFWAAERLIQNGYQLLEILTIGDDLKLIGEHLKRLLPRVDFLIVSGGLGPTEDDLTNEAVAQALGLPLVTHEKILKQIRENERRQGLPKNSLRDRMARLPQGAEPLSEDLTIAGYRLSFQGKWLYFLPGVPEQFRKLFSERVLPELRRRFPVEKRIFIRTLRFFDLREAELNRAIRELGFSDIEFVIAILYQIKTIL